MITGNKQKTFLHTVSTYSNDKINHFKQSRLSEKLTVYSKSNTYTRVPVLIHIAPLHSNPNNNILLLY